MEANRPQSPEDGASPPRPSTAGSQRPPTAGSQRPNTAGSQRSLRSVRSGPGVIGPALKRIGKAWSGGFHAIEVYFRTAQEKRRQTLALEMMGEFSGKYRGKKKPGLKIDRHTRLEVPTWSTSLFGFMDNSGMLCCALTGFGLCVLHGQTYDAMTGGGCCMSCCTCCLSCNECGRQRRFMRKRWSMPGGDYWMDGWPGDCCESVCCFPLTVLQEAREVEIRTKRRWHWVRGYRGVGESIVTATFGEETLENVLIPYIPKERDVLAVPQGLDDDEGSDYSGALQVPACVSHMSR